MRARHGAPLELLQIAQVVLIEEPDVGRAGTEHRKALDALVQALLSHETLAEEEILEVTGLPPAPPLSGRPRAVAS